MSNTDLSKKTDKATQNEGFNLEYFLSDFLRGIKKFWWLCGILAVFCAAVMLVFSFIRYTPVYKVSATFTVQTQDISASGSGITSYSYYYNRTTAEQLSDAFPYILESNLLQTAICDDLGVKNMPASISATSVAGTNMFTMTATGKNPQETYDVLISAMENYPSVAEYVIGTSRLTMISEPVLPQGPSNSRQTLLYTGGGAAAGVILWYGLLILYVIFRETVKTKDDIKEKLNQECIGVLPVVSFKKYKSEIDRSVLMVNELVGDTFLENVRRLRNTIISKIDVEAPAIMVTSSAPDEGKTTIAVNLAISLSKMGKNVILVDADLYNSSVCKALEKFDYREVPSDNPHINLRYIDELNMGVASFNVDKKELAQVMQTPYIKKCIDSLKKECDCVIVDSPPCALSSDPVTIAGAVDAALLVVKQDTVRTTRIKYALESLLSVDVNILGCVLNSASAGITGYGYHHGGYGYKYTRYGYSKYGYGYGYDKEKN